MRLRTAQTPPAAGSSERLGTPGLLRLLQLTSPALPVGAYAYSQGLEWAVSAGWVKTESDASDWILGLLTRSLSRVDVPVLARMYGAWTEPDPSSVSYWSRVLHANRETHELQAEEQALGGALARLLTLLGIGEAESWIADPHVTFATLFSLAAVRWEIPMADAVAGYLWGWTSNQVGAAVKLVPLGQTAGQRILCCAVEAIPEAARVGLALGDDEIGALLPGVAMASALHETQYSRLFRS
ncbi:MAG: urease accessory protein UreF [Deltaproteobacteria bacterium]|nr:urease accessory protein UreF [Deltaproteobacteria bacterium]